MKKISIILMISLFICISCKKSSPADQMGDINPETLGTGTLVYGDYSGQLTCGGSSISADTLMAGIPGKLNIQGITGLTAFKAF